MENRTIHKGWDRTNVPCQIAKPKTNELPEIVEAEIEASYRALIEFRALYDFAKFEEQQKRGVE